VREREDQWTKGKGLMGSRRATAIVSTAAAVLAGPFSWWDEPSYTLGGSSCRVFAHRRRTFDESSA
jgi:hypothetical protein